MLSGRTFQDENVRQAPLAGKPGLAPSEPKRRVLGDITNSGTQTQANAGGKKGLSVQNGPQKAVVKPVSQRNLDAAPIKMAAPAGGGGGAVKQAAPAVASQTLPKLARKPSLVEEDPFELEFVHGRGVFGQQGRQYDAGLNLATHGSNFAVASKALTDAWTDSLAGPADQELAFDYDSINAGLFAGGAAGRTGAGGMDVHIDAVVNDIHIDDLNLDDLDL